MNQDLQLPIMWLVQQRFNASPPIDVKTTYDTQWESIKENISLSPGAEVAVCVGSRGIANLVEVVSTVVLSLKQAALKPFITSAMGSHGGATAQGQVEVLAHMGITEDTVGAPIKVTMEVEKIGEVDGVSIFLDKLAYEAGGIVLINRIKPHTDFTGPTESGLIKMTAIGLGNQIGADYYHRLSVSRGMYEIINTVGTELIKRCKVLFGVGLVENQRHETAVLRLIPGCDIKTEEPKLLVRAREYLSRLPLDEMDLLIVDQIGKEISGSGMDPIVTGRRPCAHSPERSWPKITRIFVRDITPASEGNAVGIGHADFTTRRVVDKIDLEKTAINCVTACCPEDGKIPLTYSNDRNAVQAALMTLRPYELNDLRLVHIKNTLELSTLLVSEPCLPDLMGDCRVVSTKRPITFDDKGEIISEFEQEF